MSDSTQTKRIRTLMLLTAFSILTGACTPPSSDSAFNEMSGYSGGGAYTRTIFSPHNF